MRPITRKLATTSAAAVLAGNIAAVIGPLAAGAAPLLPMMAHVLLTALAGGFLLAAWSDARRRAGVAAPEDQGAMRPPPASLVQSLRQMGLLDHLKKREGDRR